MLRMFFNFLSFIMLTCTSFTFAHAQFSTLEQVKPWLGVAIERGNAGVFIRDVIPDTPAQAADLRKGDEILAINDIKINSPEQLIQTIQTFGVGNDVIVRFIRSGHLQDKKIKLQARPDELALLRKKIVDRPSPAFDLPVVFGPAAGSLAKLKDKVLLIEFWATWCPACRATHHRLSTLQKKHGQRLVVLGISDEDASTQMYYAKSNQIGFTLLEDQAGKAQSAFFVNAIPQVVVIDRAGKVIFATIGAGEYLEEAISVAERLL